MVSLAKKHEKAPFHLIASHVQNVDEATVVDFVKQQKLAEDSPNFSLMSQTRHPDMGGSGIPRVAIFDHTGAKVYEGSPSGMDSVIDDLLGKVPAFYIGPIDYKTQEVLGIADQVQQRRSLGKQLSRLEKLADPEDGQDETVQTEASHLKTRLEEYFGAQRDDLIALLNRDPREALNALKDLSRELGGSSLGDELSNLYDEKRSDPVVRATTPVAKKLKIYQDQYQRMLDKNGVLPEDRHTGRDKLVQKLEDLASENSELPIAKIIRDFISEIK